MMNLSRLGAGSRGAERFAQRDVDCRDRGAERSAPVAEGHLGKFQSATSEQRRVRLVGRLPMQPDLGSARFDLAQKLKPS